MTDPERENYGRGHGDGGGDHGDGGGGGLTGDRRGGGIGDGIVWGGDGDGIGDSDAGRDGGTGISITPEEART